MTSLVHQQVADFVRPNLDVQATCWWLKKSTGQTPFITSHQMKSTWVVNVEHGDWRDDHSRLSYRGEIGEPIACQVEMVVRRAVIR